MTDIDSQVYIVPPVGASIQVAILIGLCALVATLSSSILWRLVRRTGKLCSREENGFAKINVAMLSQLLLGVHSICQIVTLSAYLNSSYSTNGHFALQLSSPLILYLALLGFVQSVVIQTRYDVLLRSFPYTPPPLDGWSMSKLLRLRQQRAQSKRINLVSLSAIFLFLLAPVTATIALCKSWNRLQEVAKDVKRYTEDLEKTRSRIGLGLLSIERAKELLEHAKVVKTAKIWAGFWLAMLLIVVVIYLPSFTYILVTLRRRRKSLRVALLRLRESGAQAESSTFGDIASKHENDAIDKLVEVKERLLRTERAIKKLLFHFAVVLPWISSYLALAAYSTKNFQAEPSFLITLTLWSNWTDDIPSLLLSVTFAYHSFFSRLPTLHSHLSVPSRATIGQINGSPSSRRLTSSDFDTRSTVTSNYSSFFPSSYNSRNGSFATNARVPPYNPVDTVRPLGFSYPPTIERKKSQSTLNSIKRKAVPTTTDGNNTEDGRSSMQGSVWKEELH